MPGALTLSLVALVALGIGVALGRWRRPRPQASEAGALGTLRSLLDGASPDVVRTLVARRDLPAAAFDAGLRLGVAERRNGAPDRALAVHQAVLASPGLTKTQRTQTEHAVAEDLLALGEPARALRLLAPYATRSKRFNLLTPQIPDRVLMMYAEAARATGAFDVAVDANLRLVRQAGFETLPPETLAAMEHDVLEHVGGLIDENRLSDARSTLRDVRRLFPETASLCILAAHLEHRAGRPKAVREWLERASRNNPASVAPHLGWYRDASWQDPRGYAAFLSQLWERSDAPPLVGEWVRVASSMHDADQVDQMLAERLAAGSAGRLADGPAGATAFDEAALLAATRRALLHVSTPLADAVRATVDHRMAELGMLHARDGDAPTVDAPAAE